jgi:hypothetical protein
MHFATKGLHRTGGNLDLCALPGLCGMVQVINMIISKRGQAVSRSAPPQLAGGTWLLGTVPSK